MDSKTELSSVTYTHILDLFYENVGRHEPIPPQKKLINFRLTCFSVTIFKECNDVMIKLLKIKMVVDHAPVGTGRQSTSQLTSASQWRFSHTQAKTTHLYCSVCNRTRSNRLHPNNGSNIGTGAFVAGTPWTLEGRFRGRGLGFILVGHSDKVSGARGSEEVFKRL